MKNEEHGALKQGAHNFSETFRHRNRPVNWLSFAAIADHLEIGYADVTGFNCLFLLVLLTLSLFPSRTTRP